MNGCLSGCLHESKVVHEREREIRLKWLATYTFAERGKQWQIVTRTNLDNPIGMSDWSSSVDCLHLSVIAFGGSNASFLLAISRSL